MTKVAAYICPNEEQEVTLLLVDTLEIDRDQVIFVFHESEWHIVDKDIPRLSHFDPAIHFFVSNMHLKFFPAMQAKHFFPNIRKPPILVLHVP